MRTPRARARARPSSASASRGALARRPGASSSSSSSSSRARGRRPGVVAGRARGRAGARTRVGASRGRVARGARRRAVPSRARGRSSSRRRRPGAPPNGATREARWPPRGASRARPGTRTTPSRGPSRRERTRGGPARIVRSRELTKTFSLLPNSRSQLSKLAKSLISSRHTARHHEEKFRRWKKRKKSTRQTVKEKTETRRVGARIRPLHRRQMCANPTRRSNHDRPLARRSSCSGVPPPWKEGVRRTRGGRDLNARGATSAHARETRRRCARGSPTPRFARDDARGARAATRPRPPPLPSARDLTAPRGFARAFEKGSVPALFAPARRLRARRARRFSSPLPRRPLTRAPSPPQPRSVLARVSR